MFCRQSTVPKFLKFIPISCMGPMHASKTQIWFFNQFICVGACACSSNLIMHINASKTQLMHKNVQTTPEKYQKLTQHSYCSMLTREQKLKAIRGNGYRFVPKGGTFPYRKLSCLLCEAPVYEKHIPKPAPNGTNFLPRHVYTAPW